MGTIPLNLILHHLTDELVLDRLLLEQASLMGQCYGLDLSRLLAIFRWGTPLANSCQPVRVEVEPASAIDKFLDLG